MSSQFLLASLGQPEWCLVQLTACQRTDRCTGPLHSLPAPFRRTFPCSHGLACTAATNPQSTCLADRSAAQHACHYGTHLLHSQTDRRLITLPPPPLQPGQACWWESSSRSQLKMWLFCRTRCIHVRASHPLLNPLTPLAVQGRCARDHV